MWERNCSDMAGINMSWKETKSFDISEPIENIFKWMKSRACKRGCRNDYQCYHIKSENVVISIDQN